MSVTGPPGPEVAEIMAELMPRISAVTEELRVEQARVVAEEVARCRSAQRRFPVPDLLRDMVDS